MLLPVPRPWVPYLRVSVCMRARTRDASWRDLELAEVRRRALRKSLLHLSAACVTIG